MMIQDLKALDNIEADKARLTSIKPLFATVIDYKEEEGKKFAKLIFDGDTVATEVYFLCITPVSTGCRAVLYYAGTQIIILGGV